MIISLIIVSVGIVFYGYLLMHRLDQFIDSGGLVAEPEDLICKEVLLFGEPESVAEIGCALHAASITYDCIVEPELQQSIPYKWVCAISRDDANNLLMCLSARRRYGSICTMAKCNDVIYQDIFRQTGITVILGNNSGLDQILASLIGRTL